MINKKIICVMLSLVLFFSNVPVSNAVIDGGDFESRWSFSVINKWLDMEAINVNNLGNFNPTQEVSSDDFIQIMSSIAGLTISLDDSVGNITRENAAVYIGKALDLSISSQLITMFSDDTSIDTQAKPYISALIEKGIFNGYPDGSFQPNKRLTREEAVVLADRVGMIDLVYMQGTLQSTIYGTVDGALSNSDKTLQWIGVPYAQPPVGELRWKAPEDPTSWTGTLETKEQKSKPTQISGTDIVGSEDCLYLNIYRPNTEETNLPVLVFVHGGNNQTGTNASFNGDIMAEVTNSIIISIEYRLGAIGWVNLPSLKTGDPLVDSGNFGLLDIHQSLVWVNKNIKAFGGNPYNVTLSGQSAGGRDVTAALISPIFKGDFQKVFALSGGMTLTEPSMGQEIDAKAFATLVVEDEIKTTVEEATTWLNTDGTDVNEYLNGLSGERIASLMGNAGIRMSVFPHLFTDGYVLPVEGYNLIETGDYNKVPVLLGSCEDEFTVFTTFGPPFVSSVFDGTIFTNETLFNQLNFVNKYGSMLYTGFNADRTAERLTAVEGQPSVYAYRFSWGHENSMFGPGLQGVLKAAHGIDVDFVLGRADNANYKSSYYFDDVKPGQDELISIVTQYVGNFLHYGNPSGMSSDLPVWSTWSNGQDEPKLMVLDATKEVATIGMTTDYIVDEDVFTLIDADTTLTDEDKALMISTIMSGRFFSETLDAHYNNMSQ